MIDRVQGTKAEFTPQLDEIKAMARQDVAVARERLAERSEILRLLAERHREYCRDKPFWP